MISKNASKSKAPARIDLIPITDVIERLCAVLKIDIAKAVEKYLIDENADVDLEGYFLSPFDGIPIPVTFDTAYHQAIPLALRRLAGDNPDEEIARNQTDRYCWRREDVERFFFQKCRLQCGFFNLEEYCSGIVTPRGITTPQAEALFGPLCDNTKLKRALANGPNWILLDGARQAIRLQKGRPGGPAAVWNPIRLATALRNRYGIPDKELSKVFQKTKELEEWRGEWKQELDWFAEDS